MNKEVAKKTRTTHGKKHHLLYSVWCNMKARCYNSNHKNFDTCGGRDIKVCDRWLNSFENFLEDMGERPSKDCVLRRIDNYIGYEPTNCDWGYRKGIRQLKKKKEKA